MLTLEVSARSALDAEETYALTADCLRAAAQQSERAWLRVDTLAGQVVSLGRYHLAPSGDERGRVLLQRRFGGGRILPLGPGFAMVSLVLPHRSALVASDPLALRPEQALNRCVRGLLAGLRGLGCDAFYPGRDRITVERRILGSVSLETDASGASVFEAALCIDGDWLCLPARIAAIDRDGVLAAEVLKEADVTTLAAHARPPTPAELAHCLGQAYAHQFGLSLAAAGEPAAASDHGGRAAAWLRSRSLRPQLSRHGIAWDQLGVVEAYVEVVDARLAAVLLAGDFIADSASIARVEQQVRGQPLQREALAAVIGDVYGDPQSFLLGASPSAIVDAILGAA